MTDTYPFGLACTRIVLHKYEPESQATGSSSLPLTPGTPSHSSSTTSRTAAPSSPSDPAVLSAHPVSGTFTPLRWSPTTRTRGPRRPALPTPGTTDARHYRRPALPTPGTTDARHYRRLKRLVLQEASLISGLKPQSNPPFLGHLPTGRRPGHTPRPCVLTLAAGQLRRFDDSTPLRLSSRIPDHAREPPSA